MPDKGDCVALVTAAPFQTCSVPITVGEGWSVREAVDYAAPLAERFGAVVDLNGEPLAPELWPETVLREGDLLRVAVVPSGAMDNPLRTMLFIAVMATAMWAGPAVAGWMFAKGTWGFHLASAVVTSVVGVVGVHAVNQLVPLPAAMLENPAADPPLFAVTGWRNNANPYGAVPRVYGKHRLFPLIAATPYTEVQGENHYLRMLLTAGYGPLRLSDFRIGDTPAESYNEIEIEYNQGRATDQHLDLFPLTVYTEMLQILLQGTDWRYFNTRPETDEIVGDLELPGGLYYVSKATGQMTETTVRMQAQYRKVGTATWLPDLTSENLCPPLSEWTTEGHCSYNAGTGAIDFESSGQGWARSPLVKISYAHAARFRWDVKKYVSGTKYYYSQVKFYARHQDGDEIKETTNDNGWWGTGEQRTLYTTGWETGTHTFTGGSRVYYATIQITNRVAENLQMSIESPTLGRDYAFDITANTSRLIRRSFRYVVEERAQYEVRVRRLTPERGAHYSEAVYLTSLRSYKNDYAINLPGLCEVAVRVLATGQLSGMLDSFSCLAESELPVYDFVLGTFTNEYTSNPAWVALDLLRGDMWEEPVPDDRIDLAQFAVWASFCDSKGYEFNGVVDAYRTVEEIFSAACAAGRASPALRDGKYSVVIDKTRSYPVQMFTPRNVIGHSAERLHLERPHALRVRFLDAESDYHESERLVCDDGYTETTATRIADVEMWGVTSAEQAWKLGRYRLACFKLQPERYFVETDIEQLRCTRGDLVLLQHDASLWGLVSARITKYAAGTPWRLDLDEEITMESGENYCIRIRSDELDLESYAVDTLVGTNSYVTGTATLDPVPQVGDLVAIGIVNKETVKALVKGIHHSGDLSATLELVDYNPAIYTADDGPIPDYDPQITIPPRPEDRRPPTPIITSVRSDESAMIRTPDGRFVPRIIVAFALPVGGEISAVAVHPRVREDGTGGGWISLPALPADAMELVVADVEEARTYVVQLRSSSQYGRVSAWTEITHTVVGSATPPPRPASLYLRPPSILFWRYPDPPIDLAGFLVRYNVGQDASWGPATPAHEGIVTETSFEVGSFRGPKTFVVKAVDYSGNESIEAATLYKDLGDCPEENIVRTENHHADGFPGLKILCGVDGVTGNLEAHARGDAPLWSGFPHDALWSGVDSDPLWKTRYGAMRYLFDTEPILTDLPARLYLQKTVSYEDRTYYRRGTQVEADDFNRATLGADWTDNGSGATWSIVGNELVCSNGSGGDDLLRWKTDLPASAEAFVTATVHDEDKAGMRIGGVLCWWDGGEYKIETTVGRQPAIYEDRWVFWQYVGGDDVTYIAWFAGGHLIGAYEATGVDVRFYNRSVSPNVTRFDDFELRIPSDSWAQWPGEVDLDELDADQVVEFQISCRGGIAARGKIEELKVITDVPGIEEYLDDVSIAATGTNYLPITATYRNVTHVTLTVQDDGGTAATAKVMDKNPGGGNGPEVEVYQEDGTTRTSGVVDATVRGY